MGVTWRNGRDITVAVEYIEGKKREIINNAVDEINYAMDDMAEDMRNTIQTIPSSLVPGKVGRVDTGHMLDSVDVKPMKKSGKNRYVGRVGWVLDQEAYFGYQEYGTGDKSGEGRKNISPMHAFTGARLQLFETLKARLG